MDQGVVRTRHVWIPPACFPQSLIVSGVILSLAWMWAISRGCAQCVAFSFGFAVCCGSCGIGGTGRISVGYVGELGRLYRACGSSPVQVGY